MAKIIVYIRSYVGEYDSEEEAELDLARQGYKFDEYTQPVFEELEE